MVFTKFKYPAEKDEILVGDKNQYENSLQAVANFKTFIKETFAELDTYSDEDLKAIGIEPDRSFKGRGEGFFTLTIGGTKYTIRNWKRTNGANVGAEQEEAVDTSVGRFTGGAIMLHGRVFKFDGEEYTLESDNSEHSFLFSTQEKSLNGIVTGSYLEVCLPHPEGKIVYDEKEGEYTVIYKTPEEKPRQRRVFAEYENEDGTPYRSEPFAATTYASFEDAISDVESKTQAFQDAWTNALTLLRGSERSPEPVKKAENPIVSFVLRPRW